MKKIALALTLFLVSFQLQASATQKMWEELKTKNNKPDAAKLEQALKDGADVNARDEKGNTPLHIAARSGDVEVVKMLLAHRANINAINHEHQSPCYVAFERRKRNVVALFLKHIKSNHKRIAAKKKQNPLFLLFREKLALQRPRAFRT